MPPQENGGHLGLLVGRGGHGSRNEDKAERLLPPPSSSSSFPPSPLHQSGNKDIGASQSAAFLRSASSSSPLLSFPSPLPSRTRELPFTVVTSAPLAVATPPPPILIIQQCSSSSIVETTTTPGSRSKRHYLLLGLARLVPLGMPSLPRTSSRYKRHLSCTDLDIFRKEHQQRQEGEAVLQTLLQLQLNEQRKEVRGIEEQQHLEYNAPALLITSADLPAVIFSPSSRSSGPSAPPRARVKRCLSMPVAPASAPLPFTRSWSTGSSSSRSSGQDELVVNFPGGGKFFYWQSGVATFLNKYFDLTNAKLVGASAGALTATLMACHVDAHYATAIAVKLLRKYNVYKRSLGLVGVWGGVVRDWLEEILPANAAELCRGRVHIHVLCLPYQRHHVSDFRSKGDLIETCLASAHLPMVMDGKPFCMWRGWPCVDGSIWAGRRAVPNHLRDAETVTFDYVEDEMLGRGGEGGRKEGGKEFMTLEEGEGLRRLVEMGYRFAERMNEGGQLHPAIQRMRRTRSTEGGTEGEADGSCSSKSSAVRIIPPEELAAEVSSPSLLTSI